VKGFRDEAEEVPKEIGVGAISLGMLLAGVDEVGKLDGIADKKDRCVIADKIPIA